MLGYEDAVHYRELETGILRLVAGIDEEKSVTTQVIFPFPCQKIGGILAPSSKFLLHC